MRDAKRRLTARRRLTAPSVLIALCLSHESVCASDAPKTPLEAPLSAQPVLVTVTLVGLNDEADALAKLIKDVFDPRGVAVSFVRQRKVTAQELLAVPDPSAPPAARIWILVPDPRRAEFYFTQPANNRLMHREVPLRSGLDELGREQVAQVALSAALARLVGVPATGFMPDSDTEAPETPLPEAETPGGAEAVAPSGPGVARLQSGSTEIAGAPDNARSSGPGSVGTQPNASIPTRVASATRVHAKDNRADDGAGVPPGNEPSSVRNSPSAMQVAPLVSANYALQWSGSELGLRHGPSFGAGFQLRTRATDQYGLSWPILARYEPQFAQSYTNRNVTLETKSQLLWLLAGLNRSWHDQWRLQALLGAGCEFSRVKGYTVAYDSSRRIPWLRAELGGAVQWGVAALGIGAMLDLSLYATHYDAIDSGSGMAARVVTPWLVRPGLRLGAEFP